MRTIAHYVDQPQVINTVKDVVTRKGGLLAFVALLYGYDVLSAEPSKRKEVAIRDAFVLGATGLATRLGLHFLSEKAEAMPPINKINNFSEIFKRYPKTFINKYFNRTIKKASETHSKFYIKGGAHHAHFDKARGYFKFGEIKDIIKKTSKYGGKKASEHLSKIFPLPGHDHGSQMGDMVLKLFKGKFPGSKQLKALMKDEMVLFFGIGGMIVLAGLAGGLIYNKIAQVKDKQIKVNQIKEGIFQFIANIAMCAVGATIGLTVAKALKLEELAEKIPKRAFAFRGARFGLILGGLSLGILGGGFIANWFGRRFVNPYFKYLDNKDKGMTLKEALASPKKKADRKVEFLDAILHLDDLPTAMALAGVQIFVPFIPLFFAVSGWRTGLGYRNKHAEPEGIEETTERTQIPKKVDLIENLKRLQALQQKLEPEQIPPPKPVEDVKPFLPSDNPTEFYDSGYPSYPSGYTYGDTRPYTQNAFYPGPNNYNYSNPFTPTPYQAPFQRDPYGSNIFSAVPQSYTPYLTNPQPTYYQA